MNAAASWSPADYFRASRSAHRAWANSAPQYVIPGVLEEVDATRAEESGCGVDLLERVPSHPESPLGRGALDSTTTGTDASLTGSTSVPREAL